MSKDAWKRFGDEGFKHYEVVTAGFKYNMMDLQAALGIHQLRRVEENWLRRQEIWGRYQEAFAGPAGGPSRGTGSGYTACLSPLYTHDRRGGLAACHATHSCRDLGEAGVGTGVHYRSLAQHRFYQEQFGWHPDEYPVSTSFGNQTISLPLGPNWGTETSTVLLMSRNRFCQPEGRRLNLVAASD